VNGARANVTTIDERTNKEQQQKLPRETRINNKLKAKGNTEESKREEKQKT
jgi:hypothetical protein